MVIGKKEKLGFRTVTWARSLPSSILASGGNQAACEISSWKARFPRNPRNYHLFQNPLKWAELVKTQGGLKLHSGSRNERGGCWAPQDCWASLSVERDRWQGNDQSMPDTFEGGKTDLTQLHGHFSWGSWSSRSGSCSECWRETGTHSHQRRWREVRCG